MILYAETNFDSPWVFAAYVALREKGLAFDLRPFDLSAKEQRRGEFAERAPTGKVPTLVDGEVWLAESSAIVEYLEERYPAPGHPAVLPDGPVERAEARMVMSWIRSSLPSLREARPTSTIFFGRPSRAALPPAAQRDAETLVARATRWLGDRAHLFGRFGVADADLGLALQRLRANGDPLPDPLAAYADRVWRRPSVRGWLEQPRPHQN